MAVFGEGTVAPHAVDRDAEQTRAVALEFGEHLVVQSHLIAADGTPVGGIEREDDRRSAQIAERDPLAVRRRQLEIWSLLALFRCHDFSPPQLASSTRNASDTHFDRDHNFHQGDHRD